MALTKITAAGLTADLIDETKLADNSIDSEHYNDGSIDNAHLADNAVDSDELAAGSVDIAHLATGTDGKIITWDANGAPTVVGPGTDGQVLTSTGAGSPPAFEDAAGGVDGISSSADANAITIDSSEHVIVGGTTVSDVHTNNQDFVVGNSSNSNTGMALNCASGGYCSIVMSDSTGDKNKGLIAYNHADDSFKICNDPATGSDGLVLQSDHDVKISSGDLLFGTAGKGVVLGATSNTDANTLDDYEEGTWSPSCIQGTVTSARAKYTKIGNMVFLEGYFTSFSDYTTDSIFGWDNLPFTPAGTASGYGNIIFTECDGIDLAAGEMNCIVNDDPAIMVYGASSGGSWKYVKHADLNSGASIYMSCAYRVS